MTREAKSPEEIQAEVRRLIGAATAGAAADPGVTVPLPERLPEATAGQCNWDMTYFGHAIPDSKAVEAAVAEVKARWNMR